MGVPAIAVPTVTMKECHATRLECIKSVTVLPECYTERAQSLTALKRIESIEVTASVKRNGHRYYVIDIYYKLSRSHIPTLYKSSSKTTASTGRQPDVRIERRLSEIGNLRDEIYYFAHNGHGAMPCQFCSKIIDYVLHGNAKPRTILGWFDAKEETYMTLTQFLTAILHLTTTVKGVGGHQCQGQDEIPVLLQQFLLSRSTERS